MDQLTNGSQPRASAAVSYVLRRMQQDGRLAYLIGPGSQTYELLTQEAAQAAGRDVADFRRDFESSLKTERWPSEDDILDRIDEAVERARKSPG